MKAAIICPTPHLHDLVFDENYHLILTHEVLTNSKYAEFYKNKAAQDGQYIILDNGAYEKGSAVTMEDTFKAIDLIHPQEVVLRDILDDCAATIESTAESANAIKTKYGHCPFFSLMVIPQGKSFSEWLLCLNTIYDIGNCIGVPRRQADRMWTWLPHVRAINALSWQRGAKEIHLFGAPHNWKCASEVEKAFPGAVRGTDSAKPIHYAISDCILDPDVNILPEPQRPENFFTYQMSDAQLWLAEYNINRFKSMLK